MVSFFVEALTVSVISVLTERILRKLFYNNNNNVNNINIDYQPQSKEVIVAQTQSNNKLFKFSNYI